MVKIYMKGIGRLFTVSGVPVYEDERFFVISREAGLCKILWENIMYMEDDAPVVPVVSPLADAFSPAQPTPFTSIEVPAMKNTNEPKIVKINAHFSGFKNEVISLYVPNNVLTNAYNPDLAKEIFSNHQIQSIMGDFIVSGVPKVDDTDIYFETKSLDEIKGKADAAVSMLAAVAKASQVSPKLPTLAVDPAFSMPGSPFDKPVSFTM